MYISKIDFYHFRNYNQVHLIPGQGINIIQGENAIGKTNILEGIYYLALTRSLKKSDDKQMIQIGEQLAQVRIAYVSDKKHNLQATLSSKGKLILFDEEKQSSVSKIIGKLLAVCYTPMSVNLFRLDPLERRKFIDSSLTLMSLDYLDSLSKYKKILKERNNALNMLDEIVIEILTKELIKVSYDIVIKRKKFIDLLQQRIQDIYQNLFRCTDKLELKYQTNLPIKEDKQLYINELEEKFNRIKSDERKRKVTLLGPQKDDLIAYLNGKEVYSYCSQGQNRLIVLSLYLAFKEILEQQYKTKPILLLDDVLSDLDENRQTQLMEYLSNQGQVFITTNEIKGTKLIKNANIINVKDYI